MAKRVKAPLADDATPEEKLDRARVDLTDFYTDLAVSLTKDDLKGRRWTGGKMWKGHGLTLYRQRRNT